MAAAGLHIPHAMRDDRRFTSFARAMGWRFAEAFGAALAIHTYAAQYNLGDKMDTVGDAELAHAAGFGANSAARAIAHGKRLRAALIASGFLADNGRLLVVELAAPSARVMSWGQRASGVH